MCLRWVWELQLSISDPLAITSFWPAIRLPMSDGQDYNTIRFGDFQLAAAIDPFHCWRWARTVVLVVLSKVWLVVWYTTESQTRVVFLKNVLNIVFCKIFYAFYTHLWSVRDWSLYESLRGLKSERKHIDGREKGWSHGLEGSTHQSHESPVFVLTSCRLKVRRLRTRGLQMGLISRLQVGIIFAKTVGLRSIGGVCFAFNQKRLGTRTAFNQEFYLVSSSSVWHILT